jgi:hypothetical protein
VLRIKKSRRNVKRVWRPRFDSKWRFGGKVEFGVVVGTPRRRRESLCGLMDIHPSKTNNQRIGAA